MCLAKAFIGSWSEQPILQDIAHMQVHEDGVELETLFGKGKVVLGRVIEIDFTTSKILLEQHHVTANKKG
jgi:predicted RNA-binding protein